MNSIKDESKFDTHKMIVINGCWVDEKPLSSKNVNTSHARTLASLGEGHNLLQFPNWPADDNAPTGIVIEDVITNRYFRVVRLRNPGVVRARIKAAIQRHKSRKWDLVMIQIASLLGVRLDKTKSEVLKMEIEGRHRNN